MKKMFLKLWCIVIYINVKFTNGQSIFDLWREPYRFSENVLDKYDTDTCNMSELSVLTKMKFFDASTKIPSGLLNHNMFDLGNFDECYNLHDNFGNKSIYGKYCLGTLLATSTEIEDFFKNLSATASTRFLGSFSVPGYHFAYCLPNSCTIDDFKLRLPWMDFSETFCYTKTLKSKFDWGDLLAIIILGCFAFILIASTLYGTYINHNNQDPHHDILIAFSMVHNGRRLFSTKCDSGNLLCINGIKVLSMMWVMYGHEHTSNLFYNALDNTKYVTDFIADRKSMYVLSAYLAVDTFLAVAGLLLVYVYLKACHRGSQFNLIMFYVHRFIRITPAMAIIVLFNATLIRHVGNGPFWGATWEFYKPCQKYWWSTLLYIQNYVNVNNMCTMPAWYLATDMQLYILSPIMLLLLKKNKTKGIGLLILAVIGGIMVPFWISYSLGLPVSPLTKHKDKVPDLMNKLYYKTHARFGPYVIGIMAGYILFHLKNEDTKTLHKYLNKKINNFVAWLLIILALAVCTYGTGDAVVGDPDIISSAFYNGFNRNLWAVAISAIILICSMGYGGPINWFLSLPIFQFLSKLSYSMFLLHYTVIGVRLMNNKTIFHPTDYFMVNNFIIDFVTIAFLSIIYCLTFEYPVIALEKIMFAPKDESRRRITDKTRTEA